MVGTGENAEKRAIMKSNGHRQYLRPVGTLSPGLVSGQQNLLSGIGALEFSKRIRGRYKSAGAFPARSDRLRTLGFSKRASCFLHFCSPQIIFCPYNCLILCWLRSLFSATESLNYIPQTTLMRRISPFLFLSSASGRNPDYSTPAFDFMFIVSMLLLLPISLYCWKILLSLGHDVVEKLFHIGSSFA